MQPTLNDITALAKRRGYVYPGSEIYGGLANSWDYGPLGAELLKNIRDLWWEEFVTRRDDMVGLDSAIILHPKVWEASGHLEGFTDALVDCKNCKNRTRADHLIEDFFDQKGEEIKVEGKSNEELTQIIADNQIPCPVCGKSDWTGVRSFNLLFPTEIGIIQGEGSTVYLRGETAQGIFINFKNILNSTRSKLPFGVGQLGKSFRNELTKGQFVFRTLEFEQGEIEYFFNPKETEWKKLFDTWLRSMMSFLTDTLKLREENLRVREHTDAERSFYSKKTIDIEYDYPFGYKELWGLAYRTDYDLKQHEKYSGVDLHYTDPHTGEKFLPHVIEPAVGINRLFLSVLVDAYHEDAANKRTVLKLAPALAPIKVAVFPLVRNNDEIVGKAKQVYDLLKPQFRTAWDARGNIGKRYYYQDEAGTPLCVTIDHETLEDSSVTVRDRDTTKQERVSIDKLNSFVKEKLYEKV